MCGIAGIASLGDAPFPSVEDVERMCHTLVHRGPDEGGHERRDGVALGIRRLSIIDLEGGHQPMSNEDGSVRAVFNGEIYNFRDLRRQLAARGHGFRSRCDTEILVHGYEEWGSDLCGHLDGMFAFAIHDRARRRVLLARDPLGIKPLYYAVTSERLVWGSEVKALLASGCLPRALDLDSLVEFLTWEYVPSPATLLAGIHKLEPAHVLEIDLQNPHLAPRRYWDVPGRNAVVRSTREWEVVVDEAIHASVQSQLVADVPLGAFLSGGVDSSLLVAHMGDARTFSMGFEDPSYDELPFARRVAMHLGVSQRTRSLERVSADLFFKLMHSLDDPIGDFSIFPTYLLSRLAREDVTIALSGDGGDEIFGGYETYLADRRAPIFERIPHWLRDSVVTPGIASLAPRRTKKGLVNTARRFVQGASQPAALRHARWRLFLDRSLRATLLTRDAAQRLTRDPFEHITRAFERAKHLGAVDAALYVDVTTYLPDNILAKLDRMSMAVSLEARVPYLSTDLVTLAFQVPERLKVSFWETKGLLKRVAARHVPRACVYRAKRGFSIPIKHWLKDALRPLLMDLLAPKRIRAQGLFESVTIERLRKEHLSGAADHSHLLWSLIVFQAWSDLWLRGSA